MTREDLDLAVYLTDQIIAKANKGTRVLKIAQRLRRLLEPPNPMADVLARVPGKSITEKCVAIDISRQAYYNLKDGISRPNNKTTARLMALNAES